MVGSAVLGACVCLWLLFGNDGDGVDEPSVKQGEQEDAPGLQGRSSGAAAPAEVQYVDAAEALKILRITNAWELQKYLEQGLHKPLPPDRGIVKQLVTRLRTAPKELALPTIIRGHLTSMPASFLPEIEPLLSDKRADVRWHGMQILLLWRQAKQEFRTPDLLARLDDDDASVRQAAMSLLAWGAPFDASVRDRLVQIIEAEHSASPPGRHSALSAAVALAVMGDPAFDTLLTILRSADADLACVIHGALRYAPRERIQRAMPELRRALQAEDATVRRTAVLPLVALGADARSALPELRECLEIDHEALLRDALSVIAGLGPHGREATPQVIDLLEHPDERVADAATAALCRIAGKDELARRALVDRIRDKASDEAAKALAAFGADGLGDAVAIIETDDAHSRYAALWTLATLGPEAAPAAHVLVPLIDQDDDRLLRERAVATAGLIGPKAAAAVPYIVRALGSPELPLSFIVAGTALLRIGGEAEPALVAALRSDDALLRRQAALVVSTWRLRARFALDALTSVLGDEDVATRRAAIESIVASFDELSRGGKVSAPDAYLDRVAPALDKAAQDSDRIVRAQAEHGQAVLAAARAARSR